MTNARSATEDLIRSTERERLRALLTGDTRAALDFHGAEFELITPIGVALTREQYLGAVAAGEIDYSVWEPGDIAVRLHDTTATIRYRAALEVTFGGHLVPLADYWHTDTYELLDGSWKAVWSQATQIR